MRTDPYRNFRFRVELDGITQAGFNECSLGDSSIEVVEYREGTDGPFPRKLSGQSKYSNFTLKWGVTDSTDLSDWFQGIVENGALDQRKTVAIILVDEQGNPQARWELWDCWASKYAPGPMSAKGNDVAIDSLEFVTEGYKRVS